jgi:hypothetical protein
VISATGYPLVGFEACFEVSGPALGNTMRMEVIIGWAVIVAAASLAPLIVWLMH